VIVIDEESTPAAVGVYVTETAMLWPGVTTVPVLGRPA
jgi:hypothetical protein